MYDRYTLYSAAEQIQKQFVVDVPESYGPTYNAGPTQLLPIITSDNPQGLSFFHWGLMAKWANNKNSISAKSINLASDSAFKKANYKRQIESHRCLVPINGFYVWKRVSKKQIVPYYYSSREMPLMGIAGVWEEFEDIDGQVSHSFILLTVPSSQSLSEADNEMPALLSPDAGRKWLEKSDLTTYEELIRSISSDHPALTSNSVNPKITDLANDFPELIQSAPASDQHGNYTLFS